MSHDKKHGEQHGGKHPAMSWEHAKAEMDAFAETMFAEHIRAPKGTWTKVSFNASYRLEPGEKLLDEFHLETHDSLFCVYVLTRDGKDANISMHIIRAQTHEHPQGAIELAGVWVSDPKNEKAYASFVEAVKKAVDKKFARR